jgi:hypothetical protein
MVAAFHTPDSKVSSVALMKVVASGVPAHRTSDAAVKPLPCALTVWAGALIS